MAQKSREAPVVRMSKEIRPPAPPRPMARRCKCGCGAMLSADTRANRSYVDERHRKAAYRGRLREALDAAGLPSNPSLKAAVRGNPPEGVPGTRARPKKPRKREVRSGVQTYFQPGDAELALKHLPDVPELAEARATLSAAIERRDRRLTAAGPRK